MPKRLRHIIVWAMLLFTATNAVAQNAMPDTVCAGKTRTYSVNDPSVPSTYTWTINGVTQGTTTNSIIITWNTPGTFLITVQEHSSITGCDGDIRSGYVYVNAHPTDTTNATVCANQLPYFWRGNSYNNAGTYIDTVASQVGCDTVAVLNLNVLATPNLVIHDPPGACTPNTVDLTNANVTAGSDTGLVYTYWKDSSATIRLNNPNAVDTSGTYFIKAINAAGCSTIKPVNVAIHPKPTVNMTANDSTICRGDVTTVNVTMIGTSPFQITYTDGRNNFTVGPIASNTYQFTVTSSDSTTTYTITSIIDAYCSSAGNLSSITINVIQPIQPVRYPTVLAQPNTNTQLTARNLGNGYTYLWNPPTALNLNNVIDPIFKSDTSIQYTIAITSASGCSVVDTLLVRVPAAAPPCKADVFVPKAWSPNGDGHNDILRPLTLNITELKYFRVFNRWGQLVFETNVIGQGWDGMFNGKQQVSDTYTWTCEVVDPCGNRIKRTGNSLLLR